MHKTDTKEQIRGNAREIVRLHSRIHGTLPERDKSAEGRALWSDACADFGRLYADLAFYKGERDYRTMVRSGDPEAIEYYVSFLEVRPYFFRSGYMYQDLLRVLKNCRLSAGQRVRYGRVRSRYRQFIEARKNSERYREITRGCM